MLHFELFDATQRLTTVPGYPMEPKHHLFERHAEALI